MQRIEVAIHFLRLITVDENYDKLYTYDEMMIGLRELDITYTTVVDQNGGRHLTLDFDNDITIHFTYENHYYKIPRYNIVHSILNEMQKYYNEMNITSQIDMHELAICREDIDMLETVGIDNWADKQIAVKKILKMFNDDDIVATLMFLKFIGGEKNSSISYIERHFTPLTYRDVTTDMCIELYNANYYRILTLDIDNCAIVEDQFELIVNSFKRWYDKKLA